ncbi:Guanine nucleotide-binding protein-like 3 like protein [Melipona quadrifasciata]|uniref:Guanine nucleotide-binding protein-like 3 homolog n=1 Tax=Melipona quadrifasciata TaxID=166423 RepID=A0A0M9A9J6_9HYME|nr:Guanine nucleotide-binding protein-like 3 like protein [Melipona quadrifasciata]
MEGASETTDMQLSFGLQGFDFSSVSVAGVSSTEKHGKHAAPLGLAHDLTDVVPSFEGGPGVFDGGTLPNIFAVIARKLNSLNRDGRSSPPCAASHLSVLSVDVAASLGSNKRDCRFSIGKTLEAATSYVLEVVARHLSITFKLWVFYALGLRVSRNHSGLGHSPNKERSAASTRQKQSKRMPARKKYKIEAKVREHNRKLRKEAKKHPKNKPKLIQLPNQCAFKEDILKEIELMKKHNEEEKEKKREAARQRKRELVKTDLQGLVSAAQNKQEKHQEIEMDDEKMKNALSKEENSLKCYYKEFRKVLNAADVILEVVDARDPLGTRCKEVEEAVLSAKGKKRLVIILNKADLVPRENLNQWIRYLCGCFPAVAFKASTQEQAKKLGRKELGKKTQNMIQSGTCFGAELLMSLLANYCRNMGNVKTSIRVGVVGLPNVGKSSIINSLKRSRACNVGSTPGITKTMQAVQLDSKIKLLDSPGIVFANSENSDDSSVALKNAVKIQSLKDPYTPATAVLKRVPKPQIMEMYDISEFSTPDEFFALKATRMGKFRKGGIPDTIAAARSILEDWNSGKIRYYTVPPEEPNCHVSAEIVNQIGKEFDIESFAAQEKMMLDNFEEEVAKKQAIDPLLIESSGPVISAMEVELQKETQIKIQNKLKKKLEKSKKKQDETRKKKIDPIFEIEGNQKLNKLNKLQFKKQKKNRVKKKAVIKLADQLEAFNISTSDDYDFSTDFEKQAL